MPVDDIEKLPTAEIDQSQVDNAEADALLREETADNAALTEVEAQKPARYQVEVRHYAQYDKSEPGYSQDVEKNIHYAARSPMSRFFIDIISILTCPSLFWKGQDAHPATIAQLHFPHLTILIVLRTVALFIGTILMPDANIQAALVQAVTQGFLIFLLVWCLSLIVAAIAAFGGGGFSYEKALRFVGYGLTPMLFVGIISIIPLPYLSTVCDLLAMPWAFVVMGCGIIPYLHIKPTHGPMMSGLFCGLLLCLWGAMPMLIPFLLGLKFW